MPGMRIYLPQPVDGQHKTCYQAELRDVVQISLTRHHDVTTTSRFQSRHLFVRRLPTCHHFIRTLSAIKHGQHRQNGKEHTNPPPLRTCPAQFPVLPPASCAPCMSVSRAARGNKRASVPAGGGLVTNVLLSGSASARRRSRAARAPDGRPQGTHGGN